jgi:protein-S-isoprenylcysteine O-methyltransferase Ste14
MFGQEYKIIARHKSTAGGSQGQDRGSYRLIMLCNGIGVALAFVIAGTVSSALILEWQQTLFWLGLVLMLAGMYLRRHCFKMLADNFKPAVTVVANQPVIETGAYKWIRHPSYLAGIVMFEGVGAALANWISMLVILVLSMVAYWYRIQVEEKALVETIGEPYKEYMKRTKRLVPFVF